MFWDHRFGGLALAPICPPPPPKVGLYLYHIIPKALGFFLRFQSARSHMGVGEEEGGEAGREGSRVPAPRSSHLQRSDSGEVLAQPGGRGWGRSRRAAAAGAGSRAGRRRRRRRRGDARCLFKGARSGVALSSAKAPLILIVLVS